MQVHAKLDFTGSEVIENTRNGLHFPRLYIDFRLSLDIPMSMY